MVSKYSHFGGTRWLHLWFQLKSMMHSKNKTEFGPRSAVQEEDDFTSKDEMQHFFYHTSHNLKGPVTRLKGLIELLLLDGERQESIQYVGKIDREIKQMEKMLKKLQTINEVLTLDYEDKECKLADVVNEVLNHHQKSIIKNNIFVRIYADSEIIVITKAALIFYILDNLVENAIQYSKAGETQSYLEINLKQQGERLEIQVEDNGEGIRNEALEQIFDVFYRDSLSSDGGGLGLYIVRSAVNRFSGTISLDSKEGCYTKVKVCVPVEAANVLPEKDGQEVYHKV